jgi:hypothetical protein
MFSVSGRGTNVDRRTTGCPTDGDFTTGVAPSPVPSGRMLRSGFAARVTSGAVFESNAPEDGSCRGWARTSRTGDFRRRADFDRASSPDTREALASVKRSRTRLALAVTPLSESILAIASRLYPFDRASQICGSSIRTASDLVTSSTVGVVTVSSSFRARSTASHRIFSRACIGQVSPFGFGIRPIRNYDRLRSQNAVRSECVVPESKAEGKIKD